MKTHEEQADHLEHELTDDDRKLLDELAEAVAKRRMATPAIFFLESVKPMGYIASQVMHFFRPVIQAVWTNPMTYDRIAKILERRGSIELLLRRLEARA